MTRQQIGEIVVRALTAVAPEIDPASIRPGIALRDQLDLDSMDFFNIIVALHDRLGIDIPEVDYPKLTTIDNAVDYLVGRLAASPGRQP